MGDYDGDFGLTEEQLINDSNLSPEKKQLRLQGAKLKSYSIEQSTCGAF